MGTTLVSCVMPTANRAKFVRRALANFARQTYAPRELVVVDDGDDPVERLCDAPSIRYVRVPGKLSLGAKLNLGIAQSSGDYIVKWDDDDWQHPEFMGTLLNALWSGGSDQGLAACGCYLVFLAGETILRRTRERLTAGGTLTFAKRLWQRVPFRNLNVEEDYWFRMDTGARVVHVDRQDLYLVVRHGGNTWVRSRDGRRVINESLRALPEAAQSPASLFSPEELEFYLSLPPLREGASPA